MFSRPKSLSLGIVIPSSPPNCFRLTARKKNICAKASVIMMNAMPEVRSDTTPVSKATTAATPTAASRWTQPLVTPQKLDIPTQ